MTYKESLNIAFLKTDSEASDYDSALFPVLANEAQMYIAKYGTHIVRKKEYEVKTLPFGIVWEEYCRREGVPADESWFKDVKEYEAKVLAERA